MTLNTGPLICRGYIRPVKNWQPRGARLGIRALRRQMGGATPTEGLGVIYPEDLTAGKDRHLGGAGQRELDA